VGVREGAVAVEREAAVAGPADDAGREAVALGIRVVVEDAAGTSGEAGGGPALLSATAVGGSLTGVTVMLTLTVLELLLPSLAW
jgi:hypothetical protein